MICYAISNSLCASPTSISTRPSHMRCRSPTTSVNVASPVREALSLVCADLLPPRKRIKDSDFVTDFEVSSEEEKIDAFIAFADDIAARGTNVRVEIGTTAEEGAESSASSMIEIGVDRVTHHVVWMTLISLLEMIFLSWLVPMDL
nr:hypothetical protein [Tanacetum cinerariifolium]